MMTGLFHQLAEQALRPAPALHPVARPPRWWSQAGVLEETAEQARNEPGPGHRTRILPGELAVSEKWSSIVERRNAEPETREKLKRSPHRPEEAQTAPVHARSSASLGKAIHSPDPFTAPEHSGDRGDPRSPLVRTLRPAASPLRPVPVATTWPSPMVAHPDLEPRTAPMEIDSAPEVHIHIGRIELTAVTQPAQGKREAAVARKPMSLDEYLRQRGSKASSGAP